MTGEGVSEERKLSTTMFNAAKENALVALRTFTSNSNSIETSDSDGLPENLLDARCTESPRCSLF